MQASTMFSVDVIKVIGIKASAASQQSTAIKKPTQRAKGPTERQTAPVEDKHGLSQAACQV